MLLRIKQSLRYRLRGARLGLLRRYAARARFEAVLHLKRTPLRALDQCPFTVAMLAGRRSFDDLLFALTSLERVLGGLGPVVILSDGTLDRANEDFLSRWCPSSVLLWDTQHLAEVFGCTPPKALVRFADALVLAPKLLLGAIIQSSRNCLLMDSDVVFFQNPLQPSDALANAVACGQPSCMVDELESFDPAIIEHARAKGVEVSRRINSGLVYLPKGCLDSAEWEEFLPEETYLHPVIFSEQSTYAVALTQVGYNSLPPDLYMVSLQGAGFPPVDAAYLPFMDSVVYERIVCRHFITPVRHLMWLTAFPLLAKRWSLAAKP